MRIMIKGGVWKNTEDEILKAAVMKYGKNQWARISSLLVRKSAKQCKARWYEWLDPSIKKTEWTREEDEKLLHLAKLMPTQWRTIAPIVGRTPSQCLERYEKLLDAACAKDDNYEPGDDPRKLRPGEIDPNPESKPARPDPVDMDEDEKEMLSEARARLANTRGKKAKRKAREKQLEEARRLASLQKRRELKAAGIDTRQRKRKRKGIDYNSEIPFEKKPPPGFYDVADEDRPVEQPKFPTTVEELEGEKRVDKEARLRKQDIARNKIAQRQDAPSAVLQANKLNDPETVRKRSKLMLPAPQISDHELEEIARMGYASDLLAGSEELTEGSGATRALIANYAQTPGQGMTPLRTPQRTPAGKGDAIMMEAENLARLRESQTPLLGGDNPELHPSDFSGVTPKRREIQTPNPVLTPSATPGSVALTPRNSMTPLSRDGYSFGMTPKGTPLRDELHINEDMDMQDTAKLELRRQADLRRNLRSGLTNLPQPKNEYQIVIQPVPEDTEEPEQKIEEDMSDRIAREKAEEEARLQELLKKRSKVLQRELPRPPAASLELIRNSLMRADEDKSSFVPPTLIEQADEMVRKELVSLLEHDNVKYPLDEKAEKEKKKGGKRAANGKSVSVPEIEDFEEDELKEADYLIKEESQFLCVAMGHETESLDEFVEAHRTCLNDIMYFPTRNAYGLSSVAGNMEKLAALQSEFENVKNRMDDDTKKAQRLEQKIKILTGGYQMRAGKLWSQIEATYKQMDTAGTELECFQALQKQELLAASHRINGLWEEVQKQKELEHTLQKRYGNLISEQERIQELMDAYRVQAQIQEEIAAKNRALELAAAAANKTDVVNTETPEPVASSDEFGNSMPVDPCHDETQSQQMDAAQVQAYGSLKHDMDVDVVEENATPGMDVSLSQVMPSATEEESPITNISEGSVSANNTPLPSVVADHSRGVSLQNSLEKGDSHSELIVGEEIKMTGDPVNGTAGEDLAADDPQNAVEDKIHSVLTKSEEILQETTEDGYVNGDHAQVISGTGQTVNKEDE
ncbi:cell division cycle 5-like protein [Cornus florida]|uniref:cell division cycle 5-like protein n=1 Tax=Cornus florida TaxID=4283 RepID=UPI00289DA568|nr:cell division cycle 5-like protein [Cornus florida]